MATEDSTSKFAKDERGNVYGRLTVIRRDRSHVKMLSHNGETKHIADWASEYGLNPNTIRSRVRAGWTVEAALTTPVKQ